MYKLGIDLGGTKIEGIVLDDNGNEVFRKRVPTEQEKGYDHILDNIRTLYGALAARVNNAPHTFGIGTPGSLSVRTGLLKGSNTVCMNNMPVKQDLEKRLGRPIAIQNDANCFAMAEAIYGAGRGRGLVFGVIIAIVGCQQGLSCGMDSEEVGRATTRSVVYCIMLVYAADLLLAPLLFRP